MKLRWVLTAVLLCTSFLAAAQSVGSGSGVVGVATLTSTGGVQGLPFSADVVTETTRLLADGNRIHREVHGKIYRDSQGRTRNETEMDIPFVIGLVVDREPRRHAVISDPGQGLFITLELDRKTATIHHLHVPLQSGPNLHANRAPVANNALRVAIKREDLGTMQIEGFNAVGTRITRTVPAGAMGNEKPMTSISESWMCPELRTVLMSTTVDPQMGENTRKLINIQTAEPDPLLFQIPPDFTVKDDNPQP